MQPATKFRAGIIGFGLSFFLLVQLLKQFPDFVERYYSNGLYPILTLVLSNFSGRFNFSLTELTIWFLVLVVAPLTVRRIKRKRRNVGRVLLNFVSIFAVVYVWFYLFWGLNHFREPLNTRLRLDQVNLPLDAFDSTLVDIISQCNELNYAYPIYDVPRLTHRIDSTFDVVLTELGLEPVGGYPGLKTFAANWLLNLTTTSGWFSPFFHEVQYNRDLLIYELPFVIAHEKAHQKGYTRESEANFLAYLV